MVPDIHAKFHNKPFIMRRAYDDMSADTQTHTLIHTNTIKPPTAGVQLVSYTSIRLSSDI